MPHSARHELARLLAGATAPSRHSAVTTLPAESLGLSIEGAGPIRLPLRAAGAKKLIALARPAHVGKGTETLLDDSVRDSWEIPPHLITLTGSEWDVGLERALRELGARLGIPPGARLRPQLHSFLIYGQGQFFAPHQDSEKDDAMVATLVVSLPTSHTGGELIIDDGGRAAEYSASPDELTLVAFYADRRHEVLPVQRGYRASLTFNLLLDQRGDSSGGPAEAAAKLLQKHFTTPPAESYRAAQPPGILGFLLDHEYSQLSLSSGLFKGADATRIATLAAAAELAGCEYAFAHGDVQETHQTYDHYSSRWNPAYYIDPDDPQIEDLEIGSLIDAHLELSWWSDEQAPGKVTLLLTPDEYCAVTPSHVLEPYESQYEGYMGNYGNTLERWYHRTVMLIWPADRGDALRADVSPKWALMRVIQSLAADDLDTARGKAQALIPVVSRFQPSDAEAILEVALGVDEAALAHELLGRLSRESLTSAVAPLLAALCDTYGLSWWEELLDAWEGAHRYVHFSHTWNTEELPALCAALVSTRAPEVAAPLLARATTRFSRDVGAALEYRDVRQRRDRLVELGSTASALIHAGADLPRANAEFTRSLLAFGEDSLPLLTATLRALPKSFRSQDVTPLAEQTRALLASALAQPARAADDWSIPWQSPGGQDADRLAQFLQDRDERVFEWPLAAPRRRGIHSLIDAGDLPVQHVTRRVGRPFTLVLTKTTELFTHEAALREQLQADLTWIEANFLGG